VRQAYKLYLKSCTLSHYSGCLLAGRLARDGVGTVKDRAQAKVLFDKGCKLHYEKACAELKALDAPKKQMRARRRGRSGTKRHYDSIGRYIGYTDLNTGRRYDSSGRYIGR